jgi:alpha-glucoside transport system permease protein
VSTATERVGGGGVATGGRAVALEARPPSPRRRHVTLALAFLLPALVVLGAWVVYPIGYSLVRSLYDKTGDTFVGLRNYEEIFTRKSTLIAIRNNAIWLVAPFVVTSLGLVFAVLTERIRWSSAFKTLIFMPIAISALSAGVVWRLVYDQNPHIGAANAVISQIVDVFRPPGPYPGARPTDPRDLRPVAGGYQTTAPIAPGDSVRLGLVAVAPQLVPEDATNAAPPAPAPANGISGTVWLDFAPGGGGQKNAIDPNEKGLPGVDVEAVREGRVVASATTGPDGRFVLSGLDGGRYAIRLAESTFRKPFGGIAWLGPTLVTPSIIVAYVWIWAGFAVVVIGAGLSALPRDVLEAARVDGATEWQVFRHVTTPLLMPVVIVVLVTLIINVLKIFDLVFVIAPGSVQDDANVIALELYRQAFGPINDQGMGSALAIFLLLLVLPAMLFNFRRFKLEQ